MGDGIEKKSLLLEVVAAVEWLTPFLSFVEAVDDIVREEDQIGNDTLSLSKYDGVHVT